MNLFKEMQFDLCNKCQFLICFGPCSCVECVFAPCCMFGIVRRTGALRPTCGPTGKRVGGGTGAGGGGGAASGRHKRRPPRGMRINHDDLAAMAAGAHGLHMLRAMDREIVSLRRQVRSHTITCATQRSRLISH